jgi:hypothetical protein
VIQAMRRIEESSGRSIRRLFAAFALGCAAAMSGLVFGMPGQGEFVPAIWLAAFLALLIAPGWPGFIALMVGVTSAAVVIDLSDGVFGLVFLIVAVVSAVAAHGALSASVVQRLRLLGWRQGVHDSRVLSGGGLVVGLVLIFGWFASQLARNPA